MFKNCGNVVETKSRKNIFKSFGMLKVYADEATPSSEGSEQNGSNESGTPAPAPTINYEDLIAKARKEEKDKQYKAIEKLKAEKETLIKQHNDDLLKIAELEKKVEEAENKLASAGSNDSEAVKTLKDEIVSLNNSKAELEKQLEGYKDIEIVDRDEIAKNVRAELEAEFEVKSYKLEQMTEHKDDILVPELVIGSTKEEIDNSIKAAIERSNQIRASLGATITPSTQQKRTPNTPNNPSVRGVQDTGYSLEQLANLNPASPEYAEIRKQLGLK